MAHRFALLCNRAEAQRLLNTAIADFNSRRGQEKLFNFDAGHNTFVEFYYEGDNPQKQWHAFHIKSEDWEERVPSKVRRFYNQ